jgi:alpha-N-arabinofuranosidase
MKRDIIAARTIAISVLGVIASAAMAIEGPVAPVVPSQATIIIAAQAPARAYDRMIFGGFLEHFDNQIYGGIFEPSSPLADDQGFRTDVLDALKGLKMPVIRWPGGCFVDAYHWQKGVGKKRQSYGDFRWGVLEPNTFGTDEFVELCRRIGAEPYICFNGLADPQENLDWVAYCNATEGKFAKMRLINGHAEPFNVKFWSVGNERYDKEYIHRVRDTAKEMKRLYPNLLITCSGAQDGMKGVHGYLMEQAGAYLDYVSIHSYALDRGNELPRHDYLTAIGTSEGPETFIANVANSLKQRNRDGNLKIAYDEWNLRAWQHPGFPRDKLDNYNDPEVRALIDKRRRQNDQPDQYTMADAIFAASFMNACLRNSDTVTMANIAPLVNTRGPIFVHAKGIVKRPHYHTMWMYANLLRERVANVQVMSGKLKGTSVSTVDAVATVDKSGRNWSISLINRDPSESVTCTLKMDEAPLDGAYRATLLTGDSTDSYNDLMNPARVAPREVELTIIKGVVDLPPHSLLIVSVPSK